MKPIIDSKPIGKLNPFRGIESKLLKTTNVLGYKIDINVILIICQKYNKAIFLIRPYNIWASLAFWGGPLGGKGKWVLSPIILIMNFSLSRSIVI